MKKLLIICAFVGFILSVNAGPVTVENSGFDEINNGDPLGWSNTDPSNIFYVWADVNGTPPMSVLAFKDPNAAHTVQQNLTTHDAALTVKTSPVWTVGFEYGWRKNDFGGAAQFTVSLVDLTADIVLASGNVTVDLTDPVVNDSYLKTGTASIVLNYDTNSVTAGNAVGLRFQRTDADDGLGGDNWKSTAFIDAVTLDAQGYPYIAPTNIFLNVDNADFESGETDWAVVETGNDIYFGSGVVNMKDPGGMNYVAQSMTQSNGGSVFTASYGDWLVDFEYGWRNNTLGGDAEFTVSLVNKTTGITLASGSVANPLTNPLIDNVYTTIGTASVALSYDHLSENAGDEIELRIARTDSNDGLGGDNWKSTAFVDNVVVNVLSTINPAPSIVHAPQSMTVREFGEHTFSVQASGAPILSYKWMKDAVVLGGETSIDLTLENIVPADAGAYSVVVENAYGSVTSSVATITVDLYNRDVLAGVELVARLLPNHASQFIVEFIPPENGKDVYELAGNGDKIVLRGNTGVSVASALNRYLREFCKCHISRNGDQMNLPSPLPKVETTLRKNSPHQIRFFYNPNAFGYSSAWWDWDDWQREIDVLALHGINLAEVFAGVESLLLSTFRDHFGYTDAEIRDWLCMPTHLPWMMLGNIHSFGGPVPANLIDRRLVLGQQIASRMQALGIEPMLQGYYGLVPPDFKTRYPAADVRGQGGWVGGFRRPDMLNPTDPVFALFSQHYYQNLASLFPGVRYFSADPFHEGGSAAGINLGDAAQALLDGMAFVHPQSVWVAEAWGGNPKQEMLDAINKDRALVLELNCTKSERWRSNNAYNNTPWVWCAIQNFGGNTGMISKLGVLAERPAAALADPNKGRMVGIGALPEGTHTIPAAYEMLFEHSWTHEALEIIPWVGNYCQRRYGKTLPELESAWDVLLATVMNVKSNIQEPQNSILLARPSLSPAIKARFWSTTSIPYDAAYFAESLGVMLSVSDQVGFSDGYRFDLADVARQILCDLATRHHKMLIHAYENNDVAAIHIHGDRILSIITDLETLCVSRSDWLLGTWLEDARSWGETPAEKDLCEWNARVLLTTWSDSISNLNDYANREWAGLVGGFYLPRWQQFMVALYAAVDNNQTFNDTAVQAQIKAWELAWADGHESYASTPVGDTVAIAQAIWTKYGAEAISDFDLMGQVIGNGWSPSVCSTTPSLWTRDVSSEINQTGTWVVTFKYTQGSNALNIYKASLFDASSEIASDEHIGWTGFDNYDNNYYLHLSQLPSSLELRSIASSAGGTNSTGTITLSHCAEVTVNGGWTASDCSTDRQIWVQNVDSTVFSAGDYRVTLTRSGGTSSLTADQVWLEQDGNILSRAIRDETLRSGAATQSWDLRVISSPSSSPVLLKMAVGSSSSSGSIGTILLERAGFYNLWKGNQFTAAELADPSISGDTADIDDDQIATLLEYAFGLDPQFHNGSLAGCAIELDGSNGWKVEFDRYASHDDIDIVLEWSDELNPATWQPVAQSIAGGAVQPLNGANLVSEIGTEPTVVKINVPATVAHGFIRWKVEHR